jgi:hypothetical protein
MNSHPCHEQSERDTQFWQGINTEAGRLGIPDTTWCGFLRTSWTSHMPRTMKRDAYFGETIDQDNGNEQKRGQYSQ